MQPHEQAQFLTAVSEFVQEQVVKAVSSAVQPLQLKIEDLEAQLAARPIIEEGDVIERTFDSVMKNLSPDKYAMMDDISKIVEHERAQTGEALMRISDVMKLMQDKIEALPVPKDGKDGVDGKDAEVDYSRIGTAVELEVNKQLSMLPKPIDGKDGAPGKDGVDGKDAEINWEGVRGVVAELVEEHHKKYPVANGVDGKDGTSVTADDVLPAVLLHTEQTIEKLFNEWPKPKDGVDGKDGVSVDPEWLKGYLQAAVDEIPRPKDGKDGVDGKDGERGTDGHDGNSVSHDDVRDMVDASVSKAVAALPGPVDITGSVIDRDGVLSFLRSNGTTLKVGSVVGKDGRSVTAEEVRKLVEEAVAELPPAKDGAPGKDGVDGVGFDGLSMERVTDRDYMFIVGNSDATKVKEFPIRVEAQINKGFWTDEVEYVRGDLVTLGGSQWCCMVDKTKMRPETGEGNDWQLAVKRGRDGKQGPPGMKGEKGIDGRDGRDLTQLAFDGSKS